MSFLAGVSLDGVMPAVRQRLVPGLIEAIHHIHSFSSLRPGPLDGSHARGLLWSEYTSGQKFTSCDDLQGYLDARLAFLDIEATIDVRDVTLSFCNLDLAPRNIVIGEDDSIGILDWGCAGFYPRVFDIWAITFEAHARGHPFAECMASKLAESASNRERAEIDALSLVYSVNQRTAL